MCPIHLPRSRRRFDVAPRQPDRAMTIPATGALPGERRGYVLCGDRQVHYREQGSGPAVVLVHQAPWASIQYRRVMPLIAAAGFRAIAPDLPGHGLSDPLAEPTIEDFATLLPPLLDALGVARAAIIGQHGGALVAGRMAAAYPDRAVALAMDNAPLYTPERRAQRLAAIDESQEIAPDGGHLTDRWSLLRRIADPDWSDETIHISVLTYFANGPTREHGHYAAARYDFAPDVARIACPTLVVAGLTDPVFPSGRALIDRRPDWDYAELPGGAGMLLDRPEVWCGAIVPFLNTHLGACRKLALDLH
jgi:pimeloyl-ACP methyl ester carboxylesterase